MSATAETRSSLRVQLLLSAGLLHTHTHSHTHARALTQTHTLSCTHTHSHRPRHTHSHTHARALTQTHTLSHMYTHTDPHTHTHSLMHTHTHTDSHTLTQTDTHTHTHTHTHSHAWNSSCSQLYCFVLHFWVKQLLNKNKRKSECWVEKWTCVHQADLMIKHSLNYVQTSWFMQKSCEWLSLPMSWIIHSTSLFRNADSFSNAVLLGDVQLFCHGFVWNNFCWQNRAKTQYCF